jgi:hypothetical protein
VPTVRSLTVAARLVRYHCLCDDSYYQFSRYSPLAVVWVALSALVTVDHYAIGGLLGGEGLPEAAVPYVSYLVVGAHINVGALIN